MTPILFDLDGTLVDVRSHTDYTTALEEVEPLVGAWSEPPTPPTGWDGPTRRAMGLLVALAGDSRWTRVSEVIGRHEEAAAEASVPMPGLTEALAETAEATTAVVTMLPEAVARTVLGRHRVEVDVLVGRQPELASTPAPDQLLAAAWMLEVDPASAVVIGDSTWDAMAAAAAGCRFVGVTNGGRSKFPQGTPTAPTLPEAIRLV